jgi:hypothetical protein
MANVNSATRWVDLNARLDEMCAALSRLQAASALVDTQEQWASMNRRIDEVFGVLQAMQGGGHGASVAGTDVTNARGLFVVGHARSGTTILADALNTCEEICCLMECYLYRSIDLPNFADTFNGMHKSFGNVPSKGYWVPGFEGASGRGTLAGLRQTYRYVGEKLAFRQRDKDYDPDRFFEFAVSEYLNSPFIGVIRDPIKVTSSAIDMFERSDFSAATIAGLVRSQMETYLLLVRLALTVPSFFLLVHEDIDARTFAALGEHLSVDLRKASQLYVPDFRRMPHAAEGERILAEDAGVRFLQELYQRVQSLPASNSVQLEVGKFGELREIGQLIGSRL